MPSGTTENLTGIKMLGDGLHGFACGTINTLLKTTDGGLTWQPMGADGIPLVSYLAVDALSPTMVFVARKGLYVTQDGGSTWTEWNLDSMGASIFAIKALSPAKAFVIKSGAIWKTANGGNTWQSVYSNSLLNGPLIFTGSTNDTAYTAGGYSGSGPSIGAIHKSTDGGDTWAALGLTTSEVTALYFRDPHQGYYANYESQVFKTMDGGLSWSPLGTPAVATNERITDVLFLSDNLGYLTTSFGFIYKTTNGGLDWSVDLEGYLTGAVYNRPLVALAKAGDHILAIGNDGSIWRASGAATAVQTVTRPVFSVYPNPATRFVQLVASTQHACDRVSIYDAAGRKLGEVAFNRNNPVRIDMQPYGKGVFFLVPDGPASNLTPLRVTVE